MSALETRIFHSALRCISLYDKVLPVISLKLSDLVSTKCGTTYKALEAACASLLARIWNDQPMFLTLHHKKQSSVLTGTFNPALAEHLLGLTSYYTCINLQGVHFKSSHTYRLLWLLRSYYRPKGVPITPPLTVDQLKLYLFDDLTISTDKLRRTLRTSLAELNANGYTCESKSTMCGNFLNHLQFTIPPVQLVQRKVKAPARVRVLEPVAATDHELVELKPEPAYQTVTIATPIAPEPEPEVIYDPETVPAANSALATMLQQALTGDNRNHSYRTSFDEHYEPEPDYTTEPATPAKHVPGAKLSFEERLTKAHTNLILLGVLSYRASTYVQRVRENQAKLELRFFKAVHHLLGSRDTISKEAWNGYVINKLKDVFGDM
ncbi:RepB family plasmid replication initiator protein [Hymenobacter sublimis]|uniref:RepB family plasmid replication initiator protein n=2 Tax=Hymenobacter sublimis TaxID=2933777 RepID=A0ABY4JCL1_9BACT|nr:RepB family plasmid replication initiator protein [Hymenobacter sublimis]